MKDSKKILKKPVVFIILSSVLTFILMVAIGTLLIFPKFGGYLDLIAKNNQDREKIAIIDRNISSLSKIDGAEVKEFSEIMKNLIPEEKDTIRFLTLNEIVAKASGVVILDTNVIASKAPTPPNPSGSGGGQTSPTPQQQTRGVVGKVHAQGTATAQAQGSPVAVSSSYNIKVSIEGDFKNILKYITNMEKADRLVGFSEVSIDKSSSGESSLSATITFILPLSSSKSVLTPNESVSISSEDKKFLDDMKKKIIYKASPSKQPLGKSDPFK